MLYPEAFRFGPLDPESYDVFVVKSRVHFRRGFEAFLSEITDVAASMTGKRVSALRAH